MGIKCNLGFHNWGRCKCTDCGKIRDEQHEWKGCKCLKCDKTRDEQHDWTNICEKISKKGVSIIIIFLAFCFLVNPIRAQNLSFLKNNIELYNHLKQLENNASKQVKVEIETLRKNDPVAKAYAAMRLSKMGLQAQNAILVLLENLTDHSKLGYLEPYVVTTPADEAYKTLVLIGTPAVEPLIGALKAEEESIPQQAAKALGEIKNLSAIEPLIAEITRNEYAVKALVEFKDPRAVEPLINALRDNKFNVREYVASALGTFKDPRAVRPLIVALNDNQNSVRWEAAFALGEIKDTCAVMPLIAELFKNYSSTAAEALGKIKDTRAVKPLDFILYTYNHADSLKKVYTDNSIFSSNKSKTNEKILSIINGVLYHSSLIETATLALGEIGDPRAIISITEVLRNKDWQLSIKAAKALGKIKDPRSTELLLDILKNGHFMVRRQAALALGELNDTSSIEHLVAFLKDNDLGVRENVVIALGEMKDSQTVELLISMLDDENIYIVEQAALALGKIKDPRAIDPLLRIVKNDRYCFNNSIFEALSNFKDPRIIKLFIASLNVLNNEFEIIIIEALEKMEDPSAVGPLISLLQNHIYIDVHPNVFRALSHITKNNFGENYQKWKNWYATQKIRSK